MLRALLHLAKACLAADSAERPRNAGAVAEAVKVYLAELQELLRTAERERAAVQARIQEARKTARYERAPVDSWPPTVYADIG